MKNFLSASKNVFKSAIKPLKNSKGLTLMEVLAVLLILGVIAAIAIPVFSGQGEKSRVTAHESTLRTIEGASERYATERGFNGNLGEITDTHDLISEAYLREVPNNPWEGTNHEAANSNYFIGQDARGVVYAVLADTVPTGLGDQIVTINDEGLAELEAIEDVLPPGDYTFDNGTTIIPIN